MTLWCPIKKAPKDGGRLLLAKRGKNWWITFGTWCACNAKWINDDDETLVEQPTHWAPSPRPPK